MQIESLGWQRLQTQWGLHLNHGPTRFAHVEQPVYFNAGRRFLPFGITTISIWFGDYFESFDSEFYYGHNIVLQEFNYRPHCFILQLHEPQYVIRGSLPCVHVG